MIHTPGCLYYNKEPSHKHPTGGTPVRPSQLAVHVLTDLQGTLQMGSIIHELYVLESSLDLTDRRKSRWIGHKLVYNEGSAPDTVNPPDVRLKVYPGTVVRLKVAARNGQDSGVDGEHVV